MEVRNMPLTQEFPDKLNQLIISYFPYGDLNQLLLYKATGFNAQINIQEHVRQRQAKFNTEMLPNLIQTLKTLKKTMPHIKVEMDEGLDDYPELCEPNKEVLEKAVSRYLNKAEDKNLSSDEKRLFQDCLIHYCFQFPASSRALLNSCISIESKSYRADNFIEHGTELNCRYNKSKEISTLDLAIIAGNPGYRIMNLVNHGAEFSSAISAGFPKIPLNFSTLTFSALKSDYETLLFLAKVCPYKIPATFNSLLIMMKEKDEYSPFPFEVGKKIIKFEPEEVEEAYEKLLIVCNDIGIKSYVTDKKQDAEFMLIRIKNALKKANSLEKCFEIYEKHIKADYINYQPFAILRYIVSTLFYIPDYPHQKIKFIEMLRERLYEIATSTEFTHEMTPFQYYVACDNLLMHPVFSDMHDKRGVGVEYKNKTDEIKSEFSRGVISSY